MAQLALPVLPQYFYRYRPLGPAGSDDILKRELDALVEGYIWCSDFLSLNDPMEGDFELTVRLNKKPHANDVLNSILTGQTKVGIASLSDSLENDLMWTHYANQWSGICIEYHAKRLLSSLPDDATIVRMSYNEMPSWVGVSDAKNTDEAVKKVFSQKKYNWAYEREWRLLGNKSKNHYNDKKAVRCVYIGQRIDATHSVEVRSALSRMKINCKVIEVDGYSIVTKRFKPARTF